MDKVNKNLKLFGVLTIFVVVLFLFFNGSIIGNSSFVLTQLNIHSSNLDNSNLSSFQEMSGSVDSLDSASETIFNFFPLLIIGVIVVGFVFFAAINLMKY